MDTRVKIIDPEQAAARIDQLRGDGHALCAVIGYFDVIQADHVRRLREIAGSSVKLFVIVLDPPAPILSQRARAEMVAALAMVDYVVPSGENPACALLARFAATEIVREESADLLRAERLHQHVQRRHQS